MSGSVKRFLLSMLASKIQKRAHHGGHNAVADGLLREVNHRIARSQGHGYHHPGAYGHGYGHGYGPGAYGPPPAYGHHGHYKHHGHYRHHGHYKKRRRW